MVGHNFFQTRVILVSILGGIANHLPLKYRCRIKITNQIRYIRLKVTMGEDEYERITTLEEEDGKGGRELH